MSYKSYIFFFAILIGLAAAVFGLMQLPRNSAAAVLAQKVEQAPEIKKAYKLDKASLILPAKDENSVEVKLGETGAKEFAPNIEISKWEGEVKMKIRPKTSDVNAVRPTSDVNSLTFEGNKVNFKTPNDDYRFYDIPPNEEHKEGAYEFEVILKEKPVSNVVSLDIETENLDFYYQGELTQKEKERGASRPENVIGSYAVYYKNRKAGDYSQVGGKNYKTGKAFHI